MRFFVLPSSREALSAGVFKRTCIYRGAGVIRNMQKVDVGGRTVRAGGFGLLEAAPGVMNESARGAEYDDGVDSVDERSEQGRA